MDSKGDGALYPGDGLRLHGSDMAAATRAGASAPHEQPGAGSLYGAGTSLRVQLRSELHLLIYSILY